MNETIAKEFLEVYTTGALQIEILGSKKAKCKKCEKHRECYNLKKTNLQDKTIEFGFYCKECCDDCYGIEIGKFSKEEKENEQKN